MRDRRVIWRDLAIREAQEAYDWYESRSKGIGERFLEELDEHVEVIRQRPTAYPRWRTHYRRIKMLVFPYYVVFKIEEKEIIILSVFHNKRDAERWSPPR